MAYDRFLDLHLLADDGHYDFWSNVQSGMAYKLREDGLKETNSTCLFDGGWPSYPRRFSRVAEKGEHKLPDKGGVACPVTTTEVRAWAEKTQTSGGDHPSLLQEVVQWVSDTRYKGKIRLNAHGSKTNGHIYMNRSNHFKGQDEVTAAQFAAFLDHCGLNYGHRNDTAAAKGVHNLCLCCCYSGREGAIGSLSMIKQVALELTRREIRKVKVTGASKPVEVLGQDDTDPNDLLEEGSSVEWGPNETPKWNAYNLMTKELLIKTIDQRLPYVADGEVAKMTDDYKTDLALYRGKQVARLTQEDLKMLLVELDRVLEYRHGVLYPKGAKIGQWGVTHKVNGVKTWVRVMDTSNNKFFDIS